MLGWQADVVALVGSEIDEARVPGDDDAGAVAGDLGGCAGARILGVDVFRGAHLGAACRTRP